MCDAAGILASRGKQRRESWLAVAIVALAMLRVFVYSSAFPFFNNVDEHSHFDLVHKYARGFLPGRNAAGFDRGTAVYIADWGSFEYNRPPAAFPGGTPRLPFKLRSGEPQDERDRLRLIEGLVRRTNHEAEAPPVYYWVAARWWHLGGALGLRELDRLYWLRWFNVAAIGALVAVSYHAMSRWYPDRAVMRLGVPLLLAIWPNDFQYGINNDVLSPLLGAVCFVAITRLHEPRRRPELFAVATGLALAAAFLVKNTNLPVLAVAAVASLGLLRRSLQGRAASGTASGVPWLWTAALVPIALWLLRNRLVLGDLTGTARKTESLGWRHKGLSAVPDHPLFGLDGWRVFLPELFSNFWGGEIGWHGGGMHAPWLDAFYAGSSLLLLVAGAGLALRGRGTTTGRVEMHAALFVGCAVATLAALSVAFEFNVIYGPSRAFPYFVSGRLIAGMLLPFALLYARGLEGLCQWLPRPLAPSAPWAALALVALTVTAGQLALCAPVFASPVNWFHAR